MAVLLNRTANLRLRLDLVRRLCDGVLAPASLEMAVAVERYQHVPRAAKEPGFTALLAVEKATLLDLDLIGFLHALEDLLARRGSPGDSSTAEAALEASIDPAIGLRIAGGPDAYLVEAGIDLLHVLEPLGGQQGARGDDLALFRFAANARAVLAFCSALIAEFERFPTNPSQVAKGEAS